MSHCSRESPLACNARPGKSGKCLNATYTDCTSDGECATGSCEWLHVDFEEDLRPFYFAACGFTPTDAGLLALS